MKPAFALVKPVVRGRVELPTFRFSGGRSYRLSYLTLLGPMIPARPRRRAASAVLTGFEPATSTLTGWRALRAALQDQASLADASRAPNGIRTRAAALKGRCPRPLDDGGSTVTAALPLAPAVGDCPSIGDGACYRQSAPAHPGRQGLGTHLALGNLAISLARPQTIRNSMQLRNNTVSRGFCGQAARRSTQEHVVAQDPGAGDTAMISHEASPRHPAGNSAAGAQSGSGRHRHHREQRSAYRAVFAVREFDGLWSAQVLSSAGDQFAQIAVAAGAYERTGSPFLSALVYAMGYLPQIIGGPLLAEVATLFSRRSLMIGLNVSRAALVAVMAFAGMPFAALCALLVVTVMLGASFSGARSALLPDVLPASQLAGS